MAEIRLREPSSTRVGFVWRGAKILVLPELSADYVCRALGVWEVFAGDPTGTPAELEV